MISYYTSILLLCWIALAALTILVHENNRIPLEGKRILYVTYALVAGAALAEFCGVRLDGRAELPRWLIRSVKCADYILTPMAGGALVRQMRLNNRCQKAMDWILVINTAIQLISVPGGWMVAIDAQNHYSHGPFYPLYVGIYMAIVALMIVQSAQYGQTFKRQNRLSLYTIMFLVLTAIAMQELPPGYRTAYVGMTFGAALMFIHYTEFSQQASDEALAEQRVQLMLSQIKPHFLYNTLGSIEALCERDPKAAKLATRKFSKYLRGNMNSLTEEALIPFEKELQHTQLYLELEQIRFGEALRVEYEIGAHDFFIPPLTLEPIVENAVKHGIRKNADGRGTVSIAAAETPGFYRLTVTDDGAGFDPQAVPDDGERHVGIRNVRERLDRICGGTLSIDSAPGRGSIVTILLPKERSI